jgi:hypothetical protein
VTSQLAAEGNIMKMRVTLKSDDPINRLRALKAADQELGHWLVEAVGEARRSGQSWAAIGDALGVSRQAAWQLYNQELRKAIAEVRERANLSEEEAQALAEGELRNVRSRYRH